MTISGLGYYPNPLDPDPSTEDRGEHFNKSSTRRPAWGSSMVNTFIGRDSRLTVEAKWPRLLEVWRPLVGMRRPWRQTGDRELSDAVQRGRMAGRQELGRVAGRLAQLFETFPGNTLGLNFDPSHLIWQQIDIPRAIREFAGKLVHVHAKDSASTATSSTKPASWVLAGMSPSCPAWARWTGAVSSPP